MRHKHLEHIWREHLMRKLLVLMQHILRVQLQYKPQVQQQRGLRRLEQQRRRQLAQRQSLLGLYLQNYLVTLAAIASCSRKLRQVNTDDLCLVFLYRDYVAGVVTAWSFDI
ncbi:unnamed protein product [Leptidea sinapis]|uniref:Uncharacterized protein n=1 Tax=Leptidea sinapis TaxID=189913 RepID=A0A5E4R850_9NEOP|nr:unnamed protein product [Leptidea sinapis]